MRNKNNIKPKAQAIAGAILLIWVLGAAVAGLQNIYAQKRECIQDEGFWKGWLWCSTDTRYSTAFAMLRGFAWPINFTNFNSKNNE
jgi:hypothetical protein